MDEKTKLELAAIREETQRKPVVVNGTAEKVETPVVARLGNERRERLPSTERTAPKHDWSKLPAWAREELLRLMRELAEMDSIVQAARGKGPTQIEATWNYRSGGSPDLWIPDQARVRFIDTSRKSFRSPIDVSLVLPLYSRANDEERPAAKAIRVSGGGAIRVKPVASNVVTIEVED